MLKRILSLVFALLLLCTAVYAEPSSWAAAEVSSAAKTGLVPERITDNYQLAITREEFCEAVMLLYEKLGGSVSGTENPFTDTQNPAVIKAYSAKIVEGLGDGLFAPDSNITRQEICTMLKRCIVSAKPQSYIPNSFPNTLPDEGSIADWGIESVKYINMLEIMLGDEKANINPFDNTTREQAILLIYRLYNDFVETFDWISAYYGFVTSGNKSTNMLNGNFAIVALDGTLYISDGRGITALPENRAPELITSDKALAFYPDVNGSVYYISADDGRIYVCENGVKNAVTTEKADRFFISGSVLYFRSAQDGALYSVGTGGGAPEKIADGPCGMPIPSGNALYYSDGSGIIGRSIETGGWSYLYKGTVKDLAYENSYFFFIDENGYLNTFKNATTSDWRKQRLTDKPVEKYCIYDNAVLYVSGGSIYKRDLSKRFNIKLGEYGGESFNSYKDTVFIKDSNGKIYKFNPKTLEKSALN